MIELIKILPVWLFWRWENFLSCMYIEDILHTNKVVALKAEITLEKQSFIEEEKLLRGLSLLWGNNGKSVVDDVFESMW